MASAALGAPGSAPSSRRPSADPSSKKSFASSFWGDNDKGLEVLMARMRAGKHVCEEVHTLLKERASIEEEYGRRLAKLAKTFDPREEIGTLRDSLDVVRAELEASARSHLDVANEMRTQLEKPLQEFIATQSGIRKNHNAIVEKHQKAKASQVAVVLKAKERYESRCAEANQLQSRLKNETNGMVAKDVEKLKLKLEKTQSAAKQADSDYSTGVEKLTDIHRKWEEDMRTCCIDCQKLEEDRIDYLRTHLWSYANMLSTVCVSDDESCERIRTSLERCDIETDLALFLDRNSTGGEVPKPLMYVNFYTGTQERKTSAESSATTLPRVAPPSASTVTGSQSALSSNAGSSTSISNSNNNTSSSTANNNTTSSTKGGAGRVVSEGSTFHIDTMQRAAGAAGTTGGEDNIESLYQTAAALLVSVPEPSTSANTTTGSDPIAMPDPWAGAGTSAAGSRKTPDYLGGQPPMPSSRPMSFASFLNSGGPNSSGGGGDSSMRPISEAPSEVYYHYDPYDVGDDVATLFK
ncbi:hypothetical protein HK102_002755, partial [Quaeritorhiza haematococci]